MQELAERYLDTFNETDPDRRRALLAAVYTEQAGYTDPHVELSGTDQIDAFIAQVQESMPGLRFGLHGPVDSHHGQARFQWHAGTAEQPKALIGFDVIVTTEGRIERVYGFTDAEPAA
jgi:hypothetical protein